MTKKPRRFLRRVPLATALAFAACAWLTAGSGWAATQYLGDGAVQDPNSGLWVLPAQGRCWGDGAWDDTKTTRGECEALRFNYASRTACEAVGTAPANLRWSTSSYCADPAYDGDQPGCEARPTRVYSNGKCVVSMEGRSRNQANCVNFGGVWASGGSGYCAGRWVMPDATAYDPDVITGSTSYSYPTAPGAGDACLRCHNSQTQYNGTDIRWVESFLLTGHKNMGRKVTPGIPWTGPDGTDYVSDDAGRRFDWLTGEIETTPGSGVYEDLYWIYGDWLTPLPRSFSTSSTSYSCGRCHMTGWENNAVATKEPEKSFPGIRTGRSITGSWDLWGITCSRCHNSVVDNELTGGCTVNCTVQSICTTNTSAVPPGCGGTWDGAQCLVAGSPTASLVVPKAQTDCPADENHSWAVGPPFVALAGMGTHHNNLTSATGAVCSKPLYTAQTQCEANGGTWLAASGSASCTVGMCTTGGACSDPSYVDKWSCEAANETWSAPTSAAACTAAGGTWTANITSQYTCQDAGGRFTGTQPYRGQIITALCMDCHRQESGGNPYDPNSPATVLKVGPAHGTVAFVSHPHGNQFLNSPHAEYTGTFAEIGTSKLGTGYNSYFLNLGEAANTGNGCTGCHDVHESVVEETGHEHAIREECTECHAKNLEAMRHPQGLGTPLEEMETKPAESCVTCHMPEGVHLFRINPDAGYSTFPLAALTSTVNANTAPDGTYANAVWVDVDHACGQCHGGGSGHAETTADTTSGSKIITVANKAGFVVGARVRIAGAGALEADGVTRGDLETYVAAVSGTSNDVTLAMGTSSVPVTLNDTPVEVNPTRNGAAYMTKATLAARAEGIHDDAPVVAFTTTLARPNTLQVNMDASATTCNGSSANCDAYSWDCGGGALSGAGVTASCTYGSEGSYVITLTVTQYGVNEASKSQVVRVFAPDLPPTASFSCAWSDTNTWTYGVTDTGSTDDNGVKQVTVNWGDGSVVTSDTTAPFGPLFTHRYLKKRAYTITYTAIDTVGQRTSQTCTVDPNGISYFTISGTVFKQDGTTPLGSATVLVKKGSTSVKAVYTAGNGTYSAGGLAPGTYTLVVSKLGGYTFNTPAAGPLTVGPSQANVNVTATGGP